jgi:Mor family transcriptional regulator
MMPDDNYPEILQDLRDTVAQVLTEKGIDTETAQLSAFEVAEKIRKNWGGMPIYICKGLEYELSKRDVQIWHEFSGNNHHALCRKYDISIQRLYKIIKAQRQKALKDSQRDLFGDE